MSFYGVFEFRTKFRSCKKRVVFSASSLFEDDIPIFTQPLHKNFPETFEKWLVICIKVFCLIYTKMDCTTKKCSMKDKQTNIQSQPSFLPFCTWASAGFALSFTSRISYAFLVVMVMGPGASPATRRAADSSLLAICRMSFVTCRTHTAHFWGKTSFRLQRRTRNCIWSEWELTWTDSSEASFQS